jgi:ribosomal protein S18 acetylase RimI-like enzyme
VVIRVARDDDAPALRRIDRVTWSDLVSPGPQPGAESEFFGDHARREEVLVAEVGGEVVGYTKVRPQYRGVEAADHVQHVDGLAVHPEFQGQGIGTAW